MATAVVTLIEVHPGTLFDSDGDVRKWMVKIAAEMKTAVKLKAPPKRSRAKWAGRKGSGALNRSIRGNVARTGELKNVATVGVNVPYAVYVLTGTAYQGRRYIYSRRGWRNKQTVDAIARRVGAGGKVGRRRKGWYMRLPLGNVGGSRVFHLRVHGQRANNFLYDGYNEVARVHEALRPFANRYAF